MPTVAPPTDELALLGLWVQIVPGGAGGRGKGTTHEAWFFYATPSGKALGSWVPATASLWRGKAGCERCRSAAGAVRMFAELL